MVATFHLIGYSSFLIQQSLWYPILSKIVQPFRVRRLRRAIDCCSTIPDMAWLRSVDLEQDIARLGPVWRWAKEIELHEHGENRMPC
jgi:hypothetical protein